MHDYRSEPRLLQKLLFMFKNQKHPAQYHKIKQETFIIFGKIKLT